MDIIVILNLENIIKIPKYNKSFNETDSSCSREMFIDYSGVTVPIVNKKTGEIVKAEIFVAVLGASGYTFVDASYSQKQKDFINSNVKALEFFKDAINCL